MKVKFGDFKMNPPRNNPKHKMEVLPNIEMYAIHVLEMHPPQGEDAVEWMLITNQSHKPFHALHKILVRAGVDGTYSQIFA